MSQRLLILTLIALSLGCEKASLDTLGPQAPTGSEPTTPERSTGVATASPQRPTLQDARRGFRTRIVSDGDAADPPGEPSNGDFELIYYRSPVGQLAAYITPDPRDGQRRPAVVWITGGDTNSIGDVWTPQDRSNDQSVSAFRKEGIVMMFPSQRGGNDNPGRREGFLGEVDDVLAATDYLERLPYVDPARIYLGGHSTGGTLAMLIGECSDRYQGIFALGPVAAASQYGGMFVYCDPDDDAEIALRSPLNWLHSVRSPMYVIEGAESPSNWEGGVEVMAAENTNPEIRFFKVPGCDHFSVIAPVVEMIAEQIVAGDVEVTEATIRALR